MFTIEQIQYAHSKVRSGADFPAYIREIKELGVTHYETFVVDGQINYHGIDDHQATIPAKYDALIVSDHVNLARFKDELKAHQQGKTNYLTFIKMCAATGIEKWEVNMEAMTCTYYDHSPSYVTTMDFSIRHISSRTSNNLQVKHLSALRIVFLKSNELNLGTTFLNKHKALTYWVKYSGNSIKLFS